MMICFCASLYGYMITRSKIAEHLAAAIAQVSTNPYVITLLLVAFLLVVGCFMENLASITILAPVFLPVLVNSGIDPLAFGIIMIITLMVGLLTPPFGMVLFVLCKVGDIPLERMVKAVLPFLPPLLIVILLLSFFPQIITFLPNLLMG